VEADIQDYFDSIDRTKLGEMLRERVADESFMRLVGIYLHHVLDRWLESEVTPTLVGHAELIRYCDDFVMGFTHEEDARSVMAQLAERMASFGLTLHPGKTRVLPFGRPRRDQKGGKGPATFDFLGFIAPRVKEAVMSG
jgi:retron-type reverse transcriptase